MHSNLMEIVERFQTHHALQEEEFNTHQGGKKMKIIEDYGRAIENSDEHLFNEVFAPQLRLEIPNGAIFNHPANAASHQMSQVARTAPGIKRTLTADAGNNWHLLVFEGRLEDQKFQAIDQVHLNKDGKIDHIIIYMRPVPVAQKFAEAIMQRLQATIA
jgi:hypothetical protein